MKTKRFFIQRLFAVALAMAVTFFAALSFGCVKKDAEGSIKVVAPDGAPALAIAKLIGENQNFGYEKSQFLYSVVASSDIGGAMIKGEGDIMVMPVNAASKLYKSNQEDAYKMAGVITHGNLYIMSREELSLENLKGKVIGVIGEGLVPDLTLKATLTKNNIPFETGDTPIEGKAVLRYFADASALMPMLKQKVLSVGLLPEPAATKLSSSVAPEYSFRLDLQELYNPSGKTYPQAVIMVKTSVIKKYPTIIGDIKSALEGVNGWIKENVETAVNYVNGALKDGVTPSLSAANLSAQAIDGCKIYFEDSASAKTSVKAYLDDLIAISAKSAAAVPDDFFA